MDIRGISPGYGSSSDFHQYYSFISKNNNLLVVKNDKNIEGRITNEYWNDLQIMEIYNDLFSGSQEKTYPFNLIEFGKLLFNFLPKTIRSFFKVFNSKQLDYIPQIYIILDNMTIPFDLIYDNNFFLLKYSTGYKIGEAPLGGISFEEINQNLIKLNDYKKICNNFYIKDI